MNKVRRYTLADIPKMLELVKYAYNRTKLHVSKFSAERFKHVLDNNKNNDLIHINVLVEEDGDIAGLMMAQLHTNVYSEETSSSDAIFFIKENDVNDENVKMMLNAYKEWARQRGIREVNLSNFFMPGFNLDSDMTRVAEIWKAEL